MGNNKRRGGGNKRSKKSSSQRSTPPSTSPAPAAAAPVQGTYNVSVNAQEEVEAGGSEEEHLDQAVPEPAEHTTSGSVNMEDSQAELLASNIDDSMYMPVTKLTEENEKKGSSSDQLEDAGRSYVISPSAYEKTEEHNEEEEGVYLRPDSVAEKEEKEEANTTTATIMDNAKDTAKDAANKAEKTVNDAAKNAQDATSNASSKAKEMVDTASKNVKEAANSTNSKANDALSKARESGEGFAKRAREEVDEAEKFVKKEAENTSCTTLGVLGAVAAALAAGSCYYFRMPGRDNQKLGFATGVASAVVGLGTLATVFVKRQGCNGNCK